MKRRAILGGTLSMVTLLALGGAACPVDPGPDDDPPVPSKSLEERMVDSYTAYFEACIDNQYAFIEQVEPQYLDAAMNLQSFEEAIQQMLDQQLESEHVILDRAQAEACIAELNANDCADGFESPGAVCDLIFIGDLAEGAACNFSPECAGDSTCWDRTDTECGTCKPRAGAGEDCSETSCVEGYDCDWSGATPICILEPEDPAPEVYAVDDSCDTGGDKCGGWLQTGLACVDDNDDGVGNCIQVQIAELGEACAYTTSSEMTVACRNGLLGDTFCVIDVASGSRSGTCEARPGAGEPCMETFNVCDATQAYCDETSGNCAAKLANGTACDPLGDNICEYGNVCDDEDMICRDSVQFSVEEPLVCG